MMDDKRTRDLTAIVNSSGFLFQLRVEHLVRSTTPAHQWEVLAREHPWYDAATGSGGYIDLILRKGMVRGVVECKRGREADWVFLVPSNETASEMHACVDWLLMRGDGTLSGGWDDILIRPETPQSQFCDVRGTGDKNHGMLERYAGPLLSSVEALVAEEYEFLRKNPDQSLKIYIPIIITAANLSICRFDPAAVVDDGTIADGEFEAVPYLRFRKTLATSLQPESAAQTIAQADVDRERTIFVVRAESAPDFLCALDTIDQSPFDELPWQKKGREKTT